VDIAPSVPKENKSSITRNDSGSNKKPQHFRLMTPDTIGKLEAAARQEGLSKTVVVELALKAHFKRLGV
jgi:hypothetical protein